MTAPEQADDFDDTTDSAADTAAPDPAAEAEKWKALSRKHEQAAKTNADAARRLAAIEDRDKSETQRLTEERDALKVQNEQARADTTRVKLALRYKIDEADLDFIGSGSDEEMESRAKRYAERIAGRPTTTGSVDQGPRSETAPQDMNDIIRAGIRRR